MGEERLAETKGIGSARCQRRRKSWGSALPEVARKRPWKQGRGCRGGRLRRRGGRGRIGRDQGLQGAAAVGDISITD